MTGLIPPPKFLYDVGIVGCGRLKLSVRSPAKWMYSRSPRFAQQYMWMKSRAREVYILSAKYGLIGEDVIIDPYNVLIGETDLEALLKRQVGVLQGVKWATLLPKAYEELIEGAKGRSVLDGKGRGIFAVASGLGKQFRMDPKDWPIAKVMKFVAFHHSGDWVPLQEIDKMLRTDRYCEHTITCQLARAVTCPLHEFKRGKVKNLYYK